jgi:hypothetical protein
LVEGTGIEKAVKGLSNKYEFPKFWYINSKFGPGKPHGY